MGQYYCANGTVYKGWFKDSIRHGKGIWRRGNCLGDSYIFFNFVIFDIFFIINNLTDIQAIDY